MSANSARANIAPLAPHPVDMSFDTEESSETTENDGNLRIRKEMVRMAGP